VFLVNAGKSALKSLVGRPHSSIGGATPILALDMYEHAYHIDFGADAPNYVETFLLNIDWTRRTRDMPLPSSMRPAIWLYRATRCSRTRKNSWSWMSAEQVRTRQQNPSLPGDMA